MLGVVLWSDAAKQKAIIWCEDQGDLAYYGSCDHSVAGTDGFGEGDLIQFDISEARNVRMAKNPKRIAEHYCSDIKDVVQQAGRVSQDIKLARDPNAAGKTDSRESTLVHLDVERTKRKSTRRAGVAAK